MMIGLIRGYCAVAATCLLMMLISSSAWAQSDYEDVGQADKDAAREMFRRGDEAYRDGNFGDALKAFVGADTIMRVPTTGLEVGRSLVALNRFVEARAFLERVANDSPDAYEPKPFAAARLQAGRLLREIDKKVAKVTVVVKGPAKSDVTATIDRSEIRTKRFGKAVTLDPGDHELHIEAPGFVAQDKAFSVEVGERRKLEIVLIATPSDEPKPQDSTSAATESGGIGEWWPYLALGVGGASLIAGGVTGGLSLAAASDFQERCVEATRSCPADAQADQESSLTLAHVSTVTLIAGGVIAGAGVVGLVLNLMGDDDEHTAQIEPVIVPLGVGVRGRF
jgi:hypothetical protein